MDAGAEPSVWNPYGYGNRVLPAVALPLVAGTGRRIPVGSGLSTYPSLPTGIHLPRIPLPASVLICRK